MTAVAGNDTQAALDAAVALHRDGRLAEAITAYDEIVAGDAGNAEAWRLKGTAEHSAGRLDRAAESLARALALGGERPQALLAAGYVREDLGQREAAMDLFARAVVAAPRWAPAHVALGVARMDAGRVAEAAASFRSAAEAEPANARAWNNLASACFRLGRREEAIAALRRSLELVDSASGRFRLGRALVEDGRLAEASGEYGRAVALEPENAHAWLHLATTLLHQARHAEALDAYSRAVALEPEDGAQVESSRLIAMQYGGLQTRDEIYEAHRQWAKRRAGPEVPRIASRANDRDPARVLRVAYLSPRLQRGSAAFLSAPVIARHDRSRFEVFCYAEQEASDEVTARLVDSGVRWRRTLGVPDADVVASMIEDRIDIAIDLAGHSPGHRLGVLARRPAPVAMSWLDSFNTTGLDDIDYFVTDAGHSPPGDAQPFSEELLRLPHLRFCYEPPADAPAVRELPSSSSGAPLTFGSFNRMGKMSAPVFEAWSRILAQVPGSRLLLKNASLDNPSEHAWVRERFSGLGVDPKRIELRRSSTHAAMLAEYGDIDIVLDPFPYNGGVTTFEALLMGRPVVTFRGDALLSRQSAAVLEVIGRPALIAASVAQYVELACALARDRARLLAQAVGLREALLASPALDRDRFTRDWERALREAWARWCAGEGRP